jgi:hypothetical protein
MDTAGSAKGGPAALLCATFKFNSLSLEEGYREADKVISLPAFDACLAPRPHAPLSCVWS